MGHPDERAGRRPRVDRTVSRRLEARSWRVLSPLRRYLLPSPSGRGASSSSPLPRGEGPGVRG